MSTKPQIYENEDKPYEDLPVRSLFFYGDPKVGKTWAAASFPRPLMMNFVPENGTSEIKTKPISNYTTPADVAAILNWFKAGQHDHGSLVWDGFTNFVQVTARAIQEEKKFRDPRRSHAQAAEEILPLIASFTGLRKYHRVITGHARRESRLIDVPRDPNGTWYGVGLSVLYPDLPPRVRGYLLGFLDAYGFCFRSGKGQRLVQWHPVNPPVEQKFNYKPSGFRQLEAGTRLPLPSQTDLSFEAIQAAVIKGSQND